MLLTATPTTTERFKDSGCHRLNLQRFGASVPAWFSFVRPGALPAVEDGENAGFTPDDLRYLQQCKSQARQTSYMSGRFAARRAVAEYLDCRDNRIDIAPGVFNQPVVKCAAVEKPDVTISHTQDLAVAIAHDRAHIMGIDVEQINPAKTGFLFGVLTPAERRLLDNAPFGDDGSVTLAWTMRESLSKALKCGLTVPTAILEISRMGVDEDGTVASEFTNFGQYKCQSWIIGTVALSIALPRKSELIFRPADLLR